MVQSDEDSIRMFLAKAIDRQDKRPVSGAAKYFGISRQAIHRHLAGMISSGIVEASGATKGRTYNLKTLSVRREFLISDNPAEDRVWGECFAEHLSTLPDNVQQICAHGFTEMFNNATEHSLGTLIIAQLRRAFLRVTLDVLDDGIGAFRKIKEGLRLADEREAILELAKGKVTTDPRTHSGEGIFFTSRMFDTFGLLANELFFLHQTEGDDWLIQTRPAPLPGTHVEMAIASTATRTTVEVFDAYTSGGQLPSFDKTRVPVKLLLVGEENLVSRSQAKRLLARFARFKEVMLDFDGVNSIGQAFADEVFRVFKNQNPGIKIVYIRANDSVKAAIDWVSNRDLPMESSGPPDKNPN